ncbi:MAG TPA: competence/damage-inducible protein A [Longimicrobiales bacterium]
MSGGAPAIELVAIGDELLLGDRVDTNSVWLARRLAAEGIRVARRATVGDDADAISDAVRDALYRTGAVLCTGGLGPTSDDLTRPAVARVFGRALHVDEDVVSHIRARFASLGREMPDSNRVQAQVPEGAIVLPNAWGTAPALALEDEAGRCAVLLPGVPREMERLVEAHVLPYLRRRWPGAAWPVLHRTIRTTGISESLLADRVAELADSFRPLTLAFLPGYAGVDLRLTSWGTLDREEAGRRLDEAEAALRERLEGYVYGTDDADLATVVGHALKRRGQTLALAESCTGGLIAKRITDAAGASTFFLGGIIAYANGCKQSLLGVRAETLAAHGAVSEETAREMAEGARRVIGADFAVAVTGIAGPGGGSPEKPVGTVWICVAGPDRTEARRVRLPGDREEVRERGAQAALALLWRHLGEEERA